MISYKEKSRLNEEEFEKEHYLYCLKRTIETFKIYFREKAFLDLDQQELKRILIKISTEQSENEINKQDYLKYGPVGIEYSDLKKWPSSVEEAIVELSIFKNEIL